MLTIKPILAFVLLLRISVTFVNGQTGPLPDEYLRLGDNCKKNQKPDSAIIYYEKAAAEFQAQGNVEKFVHSYNQIGAILTRQDKYERARSYLDKALSAGLSALDTNNLVIAATYIGMGVNCNGEGNYGQALIYHRKALSIRILKLGENHADVATSYGNIGTVYFNSKEYEKSIDAHLKAMKIRQGLFGNTGTEVTQSYTNLGNAYREKKDYQRSIEYFEYALQNKIVQLGQGHKDLAKYYKNIGDVYYLMDNKVQGDLHRKKSEEVSGN